jgi:hypothetical protein
MRNDKLVFVAALSLAGCQEDFDEPSPTTCTDPDVPTTQLPDVPLVRQTEHLDLYSDGFVCLGTSLDLERHVTFVANSVGIDLRANIPVVFSAQPPMQCDSGIPLGCTKSDGTVFTIPSATYHELNHSVACQLRIGQPKVSALVEGFAKMYEPFPWGPRKDEDVILAEVFADSTPRVDVSSHFFRWLVEREGHETLADLYRTPSSPEEFPQTLQDFYGLPFEQLVAEYESTTPWAWVPLRQCADLPHVEPDDGVWRYSGPPMNCDDDGTMGPFLRDRQVPNDGWDSMYQSFTFSLEGNEGIYLDYTLAPGIRKVAFERCLEEPIPTSEDEPDLSTSPLIPKIDGGQSFPHLCPGKWRANVLVLYDEADTTQPTEIEFWHIIDSPIELPPQDCN